MIWVVAPGTSETARRFRGTSSRSKARPNKDAVRNRRQAKERNGCLAYCSTLKDTL
jgi:hypothetical protein